MHPFSLIRILGWIASVALLSILVGSSAFGEAAQPPLKFGASVSLTGKFTGASFMVRNAYELWVEKVNREGGVLGRPVELILYDDKSQEEEARRIYERLISEDGVDFVLAPYSSVLTFPVSEVADRHGYVMVTGSASNRKLWERGHRGLFGIHNLLDRYFISFLDMIARQRLGPLTILYKNNSTFEVTLDGIQDWSARVGLTLESATAFDDAAEQLPGLVDSLRKKNPGTVIFLSYPEDGYAFLDILTEQSYRPEILSLVITPTFPDFYSRAGKIAEGVFAPSLWEPSERLPFPDTVEFIKDFEELSGRSPTYHASGAFAACQILHRAIEAAQSFEHEKIREAIADFDTLTVTGRFKVDKRGVQIGHRSLVIQWQNGKKEIVHPRWMQTAAPVFGNAP